jgi:glycosyltransferase involved in cell wall biosynthesis
VDRRNSRFHRIMRLYRDIDAAVFLSDADARHFRRCGLNNTAVIRNPVHMRAARAASLTEPTIISVGRLAPEKNHRALIEAFALLADDFPSWRLRIVGDGPLRDRLVEQCRDQGLSERVHFTGAIEHVEDELMAASVFALSSESEGLALSALEAMACGVPVVMFDCSPGLREVVTDGKDVVVVAQGLVTGLADGLRRLMADEELRRSMGAAARETARRYSAVVDEWEELFDVVER